MTSIDPATRQVVTDGNSYQPDILVVALGADYDLTATPGFEADGYEYYSVAGAERLGEVLNSFPGGRVLIAILGVPLQMPASTVRGRSAAARLSAQSKRPRRHPDRCDQPDGVADPGFAGDLGGHREGTSGARHRLHARPAGAWAESAHAPGPAEDRRDSVRLVHRCPGAPGAGGRSSLRTDARRH